MTKTSTTIIAPPWAHVSHPFFKCVLPRSLQLDSITSTWSSCAKIVLTQSLPYSIEKRKHLNNVECWQRLQSNSCLQTLFHCFKMFQDATSTSKRKIKYYSMMIFYATGNPRASNTGFPESKSYLSNENIYMSHHVSMIFCFCTNLLAGMILL